MINFLRGGIFSWATNKWPAPVLIPELYMKAHPLGGHKQSSSEAQTITYICQHDHTG